MNSYIEKINKSALKFLSPLTLNDTIANIVDEAVKLVEGTDGVLLLENTGSLYPVYHSSPDTVHEKIRKKSYAYKCFSNHKAFVVHNSDLNEGYFPAKTKGVKSIIFIPLAYKNKTMGVMVVRSTKDNPFTEQDFSALKLFGAMASMAIRKAQLNSEYEKAIEARDLFFSMAAHELRTPITTIYGYAQLLHKKLNGQDTVENRWIDQMYTESYRLSLLVNDLLEINRIKGGRIQYVWKECDMTEIAERALSNFRINYPERLIHYKNDLKEKKIVVGDFDKLLQVLMNLLDNAVKFSPQESVTTLSLEHKAPDVVIKVIDQGKGIPRKEVSKVFDEFYRGGENQAEGMGLGLYLVKNIIEKHRGVLHLHSKVNKGTAVEIMLPAANI